MSPVGVYFDFRCPVRKAIRARPFALEPRISILARSGVEGKVVRGSPRIMWAAAQISKEGPPVPA